MRKMAVVAVLAGVALAAAPRGAAAQAAAGERAQQVAPAAPAEMPPAPGVVTPATESAPAPEPSAVARFGPTAEGAKLLAPAPAVADAPKLAHTPAYRAREGVPLMIVGGALFLAGAIIDSRAGDAVMVAGVVVAAIGLYQFLQ